ncbi:hypothetical protein BG011_000399 [Mortierella polycephala]|uniref:AD domain-containing protein n=1 Tax=Mortierella polycephala TaxID=41804 RepID=A0A9P6QAF6_9FUNG|nr:hypothetical protein BG011_000399 [Mortierella polycephala]
MAQEWSFFGCSLRHVHSQLGSRCQATLLNGKVVSGHLYNVDPETETLFILQTSNDQQNHVPGTIAAGPRDNSKDSVRAMVAMRKPFISEFHIADDSKNDKLELDEMDAMAHISPQVGSVAEIKARKGRLVAMLQSKRIPVETTDEDAVIHILHCAHVHPPYLPSTIGCQNSVVRDRVESMLQDLQAAEMTME